MSSTVAPRSTMAEWPPQPKPEWRCLHTANFYDALQVVEQPVTASHPPVPIPTAPSSVKFFLENPVAATRHVVESIGALHQYSDYIQHRLTHDGDRKQGADSSVHASFTRTHQLGRLGTVSEAAIASEVQPVALRVVYLYMSELFHIHYCSLCFIYASGFPFFFEFVFLCNCP
jgi:hypothetical protein